jgi:hypothetical protein
VPVDASGGDALRDPGRDVAIEHRDVEPVERQVPEVRNQVQLDDAAVTGGRRAL